MMIYILVGSLLLMCVLFMAWKSLESNTKQQDSALKQRAIFNISEQITFTRLKEILPQSTVLAHVSFDALLTTKYSRTRHKYRNMVADFVVLDKHYQVSAIITLDDPMALRRPQNAQYQDALLEMAGYRVIRYEDVPEYYQLRQDFLIEKTTHQQFDRSAADSIKKYDFYPNLDRKKIRILG
ncbi:DUF2726 domain-containing protein [Acinetobacter bouvetii]|uniref:DUF2726 domain-containing protein n=1 Tax=Acinetobacter bouvetii TaxID=202951 RepID=A0A811GG28_9GAMM|nr:DUF2726 domain-containing protein [Acinetobacter bouvetii]CAB1219901.1 hypothetical protein SFB21_2477 [Acinetobacter bouvetii]